VIEQKMPNLKVIREINDFFSLITFIIVLNYVILVIFYMQLAIYTKTGGDIGSFVFWIITFIMNLWIAIGAVRNL
jgi:hypothetical protein